MLDSEWLPIALRGGIVLTTAATMILVVLSWVQPLFLLAVSEAHSSVEQTVFTTHVYTPLGEKRVAATSFFSCPTLVRAFSAGQGAGVFSLIFCLIAFTFSAFQPSAYFTSSRQRVVSLCVMPVLALLITTLLLQLVALGVFGAMYKHEWCTTPSSSSDSDVCNPFDGCVLSFAEMGYVKGAGFTMIWLASVAALLSVCQELALFLLATRESEPAATLLLPENDEDGEN